MSQKKIGNTANIPNLVSIILLRSHDPDRRPPHTDAHLNCPPSAAHHSCPRPPNHPSRPPARRPDVTTARHGRSNPHLRMYAPPGSVNDHTRLLTTPMQRGHLGPNA